MKTTALLAGAMLVALAGAVSSKEKKMDAPCPMLVPGAEVSVVLIPTGAVIHVESADPAVLVKIYAAARAETPAHAHKKTENRKTEKIDD